MSKRYSNKGYHARQAVQPKKDNTNVIITWVTVGLCVAVVAAIVLAIMVATGAFEPKFDAPEVDMEEVKSEIDSFKVIDFTETDEVTEYVRISVKDYGMIVLRLRPDVAPKSVENFQNLVKSGHYDGKIFHRVIQNFMIQGGGFDTTGKQTTTAGVVGEFESNGHVNNLLHVRGVLSMARAQDNNSATNQFFICDATSSHLDGDYAAFGYVLAGMNVVDKIAAVAVDSNSKPSVDVVITDVTFVQPLK